ncbi:MAG: hypothetical protein R3C14_18600 [Caldilineaceae bacterium]
MRSVLIQILFSCIVVMIIMSACNTGIPSMSTPTRLPLSLPIPPIHGIATPAPTPREAFLASTTLERPTMILVTKAQSLSEFINSVNISKIDDLEIDTRLKLAAKRLIIEYTNPSLPDELAKDTLVAIPALDVRGFNRNSVLTSGSTKPILLVLSSPISIEKIAVRLDVSVEALRQANPTLGQEEQIPANTILVIP